MAQGATCTRFLDTASYRWLRICIRVGHTKTDGRPESESQTPAVARVRQNMPCEAVSSSSMSVVYQDDYQTRQPTLAFSMPRTCQVSWAHDLFRLHVRHLLPGPVDRCHRAESGAADRSVVCPTPGDPDGLRHGLWIADDCHLLPQHPSRPVEYYTNIY